MRLRGAYEVSTDKERIQRLADLIEEGSENGTIRERALAIVKNCPSRDYLCELKSIFQWLKQFKFRGDVAGRDTYHAAKTLHRLTQQYDTFCDCDDALVLVASLAASIGYYPLIKIVTQKASEPFHHIYALAGVPPDKPTHWYAMDVSKEGSQFGKEPSYVKSQCYKVIFE